MSNNRQITVPTQEAILDQARSLKKDLSACWDLDRDCFYFQQRSRSFDWRNRKWKWKIFRATKYPRGKSIPWSRKGKKQIELWCSRKRKRRMDAPRGSPGKGSYRVSKGTVHKWRHSNLIPAASTNTIHSIATPPTLPPQVILFI